MIEKVAYFLADVGAVGSDDGVAEFIDFLFRHRPYALHCLLRIPRAALPEGVHNVEQSAECFLFFFPAVHISFD